MKRTPLQSIIAAECCNHFLEGPGGAANWCVAKERVCSVFATFRRCKWFEDAVLPAWPDVAAEYAYLAGQEIDKRPASIAKLRVCRHCGEAFRPEHNRQLYCGEACVLAGARRTSSSRGANVA